MTDAVLQAINALAVALDKARETEIEAELIQWTPAQLAAAKETSIRAAREFKHFYDLKMLEAFVDVEAVVLKGGE